MHTAILEVLDKFGYFGMALLIAIENIFPPIPSEVILTFGGFATTISHITIVGAIIASTIGSVIGAIILYGFGRILNEDKIEKVSRNKIGKIIGIKKENIEKSFKWFNSKGKYAVFLGRFIPIIRSLVSIPAGMAKMNMLPFLVLTTVGSAIWNTILIILGKIAGSSWLKIAGYVGTFSDAILICSLIIFLIGILMFYLKNNKKITIIKIKKNKYLKKS